MYVKSPEHLKFVSLPPVYDSCMLLQKYLYAVGGNDGAASLDSCERYDPHLNKWTVMASMNKRRAGAGCAELEGVLYVVGPFIDRKSVV